VSEQGPRVTHHHQHQVLLVQQHHLAPAATVVVAMMGKLVDLECDVQRGVVIIRYTPAPTAKTVPRRKSILIIDEYCLMD